MLVDIPIKTWKKLEKLLDKLEETEVKTEWVNEEEAAKILGIQKVTLRNYVRLGNIRHEWYRTGVGGNKFFDKEALQGLKNFK